MTVGAIMRVCAVSRGNPFSRCVGCASRGICETYAPIGVYRSHQGSKARQPDVCQPDVPEKGQGNSQGFVSGRPREAFALIGTSRSWSCVFSYWPTSPDISAYLADIFGTLFATILLREEKKTAVPSKNLLARLFSTRRELLCFTA